MLEITETSSKKKSCGCAHGSADGAMPELVASSIPHEIRHAAIIGALDSLATGQGMILTAGHMPRPLLKQIEQKLPGAFEITVLDEGPEAWRLQFVRN